MDATAWPYDPETPFQRPLGGSQSAACYLAPELVKLGHRVTLANRADEPRVVRGVRCQPIRGMEDGILRNADCVVHLSDFVDSYLAELKAQCHPDARQILWTGHAHDRAAVAGLAQSEIQSLIDGFAMVSEWQAACYCLAVRPGVTRGGNTPST